MKRITIQGLDEIRQWRVRCNRQGEICVALGLAALGTKFPALCALGAMLYVCCWMDDLVKRRFPPTLLFLRAATDPQMKYIGQRLERAAFRPRSLVSGVALYLIGWVFLVAVATFSIGQELETMIF